MNMNRRDALKIGATGVAAAAVATLTGCNHANTGVASKAQANKNVLGHHQVVIIGGGFGGLTVANNIKKQDKTIDVLVIEKRDTFMACPVSNTYLGKLDGINLGTFIFEYSRSMEKYGYEMLKSEVVDIDRKNKEVHTAAGTVTYDKLVLSPGIAYDYEGQFPHWSKDKITQVKRNAPGALIPGSEHVALERNLMDMDDGDVIITVPPGKFRCPPAPFERASMIAAFMKKEDIQGKVVILNPTEGFAKKGAFLESWKELYGDRIVFMPNCKLDDVDVENKTIHFTQDGKKKSHKYQVLNLIPKNKANPVVEMAGIETEKGVTHKVLMNGCSFQTKTDPDIYAVGDIVGHALPPSGETATWEGRECADEIVHTLHGKSYELPVKTKTIPGANVCFSMVGDKPEEAIRVIHNFSWTGEVIKGQGFVPKSDKTGKFRDRNTAKALRDWYRGITTDLFS